MNRQSLITFLAIALIALGAWLSWPDGKPLPTVTFTTTDGQTIQTSALKGKAVLINFWSVSCEICLRDMPALSRLHDTLADRDFMVIGVAMPHDPPPAVIELAAKLEPSYPIALDPRGEISKAFGDVAATPTSFLVDRAGKIRYTAQGPLDETRVRATVSTL